MPTPNPAKIRAFQSPHELCEWLSVNHANEDELRVKIYKKGTGILSVTWNDVVIETRCWGGLMASKSHWTSTLIFTHYTKKTAKQLVENKHKAC